MTANQNTRYDKQKLENTSFAKNCFTSTPNYLTPTVVQRYQLTRHRHESNQGLLNVSHGGLAQTERWHNRQGESWLLGLAATFPLQRSV